MATPSDRTRSVLVTGASRGIGRAIAEAFAQGGWRTIGVARSAAEVTGVQMHQMDCCDEPAMTRLIASLETLDVLVNNAGIARSTPLVDTPTEEFREVMETNVVAAFVAMREAARRMVREGGGHIINIASDAAVMGIGRMTAYVGSKHALLGMGRSVGLELRKQGVRVTTYCPGPVDTQILGPGDPNALQSADIAQTILHLAELPESMEVQEMLVRPTKT